MRTIKQLLFAAILAVSVTLVTAPVGVGAINAIDDTCKDSLNANSVICQKKTDGAPKLIGAIVNTLLFLIGVAAVIVIIIGAFRYTTAGGAEKNIVEAKNTILYAVIGLVIAFSAYAIVNWVMKAFG